VSRSSMERRRLVRVPASSANLGPGFDSFACALSLHMELEVVETGRFAVVTDLPIARDHRNLAVRGFARLHPPDDFEFRIRSDIPLSGGLGTSAAAYVAGLMAADHLFELDADLLEHSAQLEGHPDNVAAALYGGITVCAPPGSQARRTPPDPIELAAGGAQQLDATAPVRLDPPQGVEGILVIPFEEVSTERAREAMPAEVPLEDATHNVAAAAQLVLGIERSDLTLIDRGLADRLHQPHRSPIYPRSMEIVEAARELGAIGATISGSGPTVLIWSYWQSGATVAEALAPRLEGWAELRRAPFTPLGASVEI
jgi:homoserine kinase